MRMFGSHWRIRLTPDPGQETKTEVVWSRLKVLWFSKDNPTGHSERKKKSRQTAEVWLPLNVLWFSKDDPTGHSKRT